MSAEEFRPLPELRKYYGKDWENSHDTDASAESFLSHIRRFLSGRGVDIADKKILELGSGDGRLLKAMHKENLDVTAVDASPYGGPKDRLIIGRIERLPFADESFDVLVSYGVFDTRVYRQIQPMMLSEIARVLKKGGVYYNSGASNILPEEPEKFGLDLISNPKDPDFEFLYKKRD